MKPRHHSRLQLGVWTAVALIGVLRPVSALELHAERASVYDLALTCRLAGAAVSIAASGFRRIALFNASPWNEELIAAAARDLRIAHGL